MLLTTRTWHPTPFLTPLIQTLFDQFSSSDDDDDDDEEDDDEPNKTGVGMYISHHLSTYMSENDVSSEI